MNYTRSLLPHVSWRRLLALVLFFLKALQGISRVCSAFYICVVIIAAGAPAGDPSLSRSWPFCRPATVRRKKLSPASIWPAAPGHRANSRGCHGEWDLALMEGAGGEGMGCDGEGADTSWQPRAEGKYLVQPLQERSQTTAASQAQGRDFGLGWTAQPPSAFSLRISSLGIQCHGSHLRANISSVPQMVN